MYTLRLFPLPANMLFRRYPAYTPLLTVVAVLISLSSAFPTVSTDPPIAPYSADFACKAVKHCLKTLDAHKSCPILPVPPASLFSPVPPGHYSLTRVRDDVWMYGEGIYLPLILKSGTHLAVIDFPNNLDGPVERIIEATERVLNGTIPTNITMLYTHAHFDHLANSVPFHRHFRHKYPAATLQVWGTPEICQLILDSDSKRAIMPDVLVGPEGRSLRVGPGLDVHMKIIGGHTSQDLRFFIPRNGKQPSIAMHVDNVFPGWAPPFNMALTEDLGAFISSMKAMLPLDFDIFTGGHMRLATRKDVEHTIGYAEDVIDAAAEAMHEVTPRVLRASGIGLTKDAAAPQFGNIYFESLGMRDRLTLDKCYRTMLEKWGCIMAGMDYVTHSHCLTAMKYVRSSL